MCSYRRLQPIPDFHLFNLTTMYMSSISFSRVFSTIFTYVCLGVFFLLGLHAFAQPLLKKQIFPIRSYDIREKGYPFGVVAGSDKMMAMLQYWPTDPFHKAENIYLQMHRLEDYSLKWDKPATDLGKEYMEVNELRKLDRSLALIGRQYVPKEKRIMTVARFFDMEGNAASEPVAISTYKGKPGKNMTQATQVSPAQKCMLWEARDGDDYYASVWSTDGRGLWKGALDLPHSSKYDLAQSAIADNGDLYLLMTYAKGAKSMKDAAYPPLLVVYNGAKKEFVTDTLQLDSAYCSQAWLTVLPTGKPVVVGAWSRGASATTIKVNHDGDSHYWEGFFGYAATFEEGVLTADTLHQDSLPASWREPFGVIAAQFQDYRLVVDKEKSRRVILLAEEAGVSGDIVSRGKVGLLAIDPLYGTTKWGAVLNKDQRDRGSDRFLSYVPMVAKGKLNLVYLTEVGAPGKMTVAQYSLGDGKMKSHVLANNEETGILFLPQQSGPVDSESLILIGLADPSQNNFALFRITF